MHTDPPPLVLGSSSPYRAALLRRLGLPFTTASPAIDESPLPGETPEAMVRRLTRAKAEAVAAEHPAHLIIASDQCAVCEGRVLGKPGDHERAVAQLLGFSGRAVRFLTGLALYNSASGHLQLDVVPYTVHFRELDRARVERYLRAERPYQCAGSFRSEGLGITLFRRMVGDDPNALVGLPLIRLTDFLAAEGIELPLQTGMTDGHASPAPEAK